MKECSEHVNTKFFERFEQSVADTIGTIRTAPLDELVFVTDEYLRPYLEFVQDNCSIYRAMLANGHTLQAQERFEALAKHVIDPVLERFGYPSEQRAFVISFYVHGLSAVVQDWIQSGCETPIDEMARIIKTCVHPNGTNRRFANAKERRE